MPLVAITPQATRARHLANKGIAMQTSRRFANTTTEYPCVQPQVNHRLAAYGSSEIKSLNGTLLMTTRVSLIFTCLRRLLALLYGINQPVVHVQRAQAATIFVANPAGNYSLHPRAYAQTETG